MRSRNAFVLPTTKQRPRNLGRFQAETPGLQPSFDQWRSPEEPCAAPPSGPAARPANHAEEEILEASGVRCSHHIRPDQACLRLSARPARYPTSSSGIILSNGCYQSMWKRIHGLKRWHLACKSSFGRIMP
jgi:hypothetical protein